MGFLRNGMVSGQGKKCLVIVRLAAARTEKGVAPYPGCAQALSAEIRNIAALRFAVAVTIMMGELWPKVAEGRASRA